MDQSDEFVFGIRKFIGTDYSAWKFRVMSVIKAKKGQEAFTSEKPADTASEDTKNRWTNADNAAQAVIIACIADSHLSYLQDDKIKSAKDMINRLDSVFEKRSICTRLMLRKKLFTFKIDASEPLTDAFRKFDDIVRQLKAAGSNIDHLDEICHLFMTLPEKYRGAITALETLPEDRLTMEYVKSRLLDDEARTCSYNVHDDDTSAFYTNKKVRGKPTRSDSERSNNGHKKDILKCTFCGKDNHTSNRCFKRKKMNSKSNSHNVEAAESVLFLAEADDTSTESTCSLVEDTVVFYLDSGCTDHMVSDIKLLSNAVTIESNVKAADKNTVMKATHRGIVNVFFDGKPIQINNTLCVPELRRNLLSVAAMTDNDISLFYNGSNVVITKNGKFVAEGFKVGRLYEVTFKKNLIGSFLCDGSSVGDLWHRRFGHLSDKYLSMIIKKKLVDGLDDISDELIDNSDCVSCIQSKQTALPFNRTVENRSSRLLELTHSDLCKIENSTHDGKHYILTLVDDFSHFCTVYLLKHKSETSNYIKEYFNRVTAMFNVKPSVLRCDRGGEYSSNDLKEWMRDKGIKIQYTIGYTPQHNGVAERINRTICDKIRALLFDSCLPKMFWGEACRYAIFCMNRSPTSALNFRCTPAELFYGRKPRANNLKVFGCKAFRLLHPHERKKLDRRSEECIFIGYYDSGFRLWSVEDRQVKLARNVLFKESQKGSDLFQNKNLKGSRYAKFDLENVVDRDRVVPEPSSGHASQSSIQNETPNTQSSSTQSNSLPVVSRLPALTSVVDQPTQASQKSGRVRHPPSYLKDYEISVNNIEAEIYDIPNSIAEIGSRDDCDKWMSAAQGEMESMSKNEVWSLVSPPPDVDIIRSRWVFSVKRHKDGSIDRYRARLCAKGCMQKGVFKFSDVYSPTASYETVKAVLASICEFDLEAVQLDVKAAFLYGKLDKPIYMYQPEGFDDGSDRVCKLIKSMYGLRQSSKCWYRRFDAFMASTGFIRSKVEPCLYYSFDNGAMTYVLLYVDDLIIASSSLAILENVQKSLSEEFEMSKLANLDDTVFVGLNISRDRKAHTMRIDQFDYVNRLLIKYGMENSYGCKVPMEAGLSLSRSNDACPNVPYQELIGTLMFLTRGTRPDICFAVSYLSRFQNNYGQEHWNALKRVLRYLKLYSEICLRFKKSDDMTDPLLCFVDADFANDKEDRKSTTGFIFFLFGNPIHWSCVKQTIVAQSTTAAEYIALGTSLMDLLSLRDLLLELRLIKTNTIKVYEDNLSAIAITQFCKEKRTKAVDVKYHLSRDLVEKKIVDIIHINSSDQIADVLTKPLPYAKHSELISKIFNFKMFR